MKNLPTSDEKMMAAVAHGSIFLLFLGPIVPTLIWNSQRRKSEYVRLHALQAMGYQTIFFWVWLFAVFGIVLLSILIAVPLSIFWARTSTNIPFIPFLIQSIIFIGIFGFMGAYVLLGFIGALFCFTGRDFRYPLLGNWLERYLSRDAESHTEINDVQEDNWVAGICHATAVMQLWGIVLPTIVWITQKERSLRLRFQALQAMAYQGIVFIAYLLGMIIYMLLFFGMFFVLITGGMLGSGREISGPLGIVFIVVFVGTMLFGMLISLLVPLYRIFALIAAIRIINGHDFHYPILGKLLANQMKLVELPKGA